MGKNARTSEVTLDPVFRTERIIIDGEFVGVISLSFVNKTDCYISGFSCEQLNTVRYRKVLFDLVRSTGRNRIHYTRYVRGKEFKRVIEL